ncbi:MAG: hypothetical protein INR69_16190 [Mucilaginibacter polytrichastri]|nr:hypothetical protein [Mucilaginibacter polytrichastri]
MSIIPGSLSLWWLLPALLVSAALVWLLYGRRPELDKRLSVLLFTFRTAVFTLIFLLLLAPLILLVSKRLEKPLVILAQDNSASVKLGAAPGFDAAKYEADLRKLQAQIGAKYEVVPLHFGTAVKPGLQISGGEKGSDLASVFRYVQDSYPERNIGAVILSTDGIYNRGADPLLAASNLRAAVYTVALGDTTVRRDAGIAQINYNQVAYAENDLLLEVLVEAYRCRNENLVVTATNDIGHSATKNIRVDDDAFSGRVQLSLPAGKPGTRKITVNIRPVAGERTLANNRQTIYVDVLKGRRNVLILAAAPHPDIGVLKQAISNNQNYTVKSALFADWKPDPEDAPELIILHQLPQAGSVQTGLKEFPRVPRLFIIGAATDLAQLNQAQTLLQIAGNSGSTQEALPMIRPGFSQFTISDTLKQRITQFPPLQSPLATYQFNGPSAVFLMQKNGSQSPLLSFSETNPAVAVLAGEGIWRWRLTENQRYGNSKAVDELIGQTVQYLTAGNRDKPFRVIPARNTFDEGENVQLNAELYNASNELVNTPDARITFRNTGTNRQYSFQFSRSGKSYTLDAGTLPAGGYTYNAEAFFGGKKYTDNGRITITGSDVEAQRLTADHQVLYRLAETRGGKMVMPGELFSLVKMLDDNDQVKTIAYSDKRYDDLIDVKWLFALIALLLISEWFLRKRGGRI